MRSIFSRCAIVLGDAKGFSNSLADAGNFNEQPPIFHDRRSSFSAAAEALLAKHAGTPEPRSSASWPRFKRGSLCSCAGSIPRTNAFSTSGSSRLLFFSHTVMPFIHPEIAARAPRRYANFLSCQNPLRGVHFSELPKRLLAVVATKEFKRKH